MELELVVNDRCGDVDCLTILANKNLVWGLYISQRGEEPS